MSDWGQGVINNDIEWGRGSTNNDIGWGSSYANSWSGDTALQLSSLLDQFGGATVAYSVRKLSSTATNALRVRRSNDNAEQDIGFSGNDLDTASLLSFVGANNGFVVTWYDQSGNGLHITNATAAQQPIIVSNGVLIQTNNKPSVRFDGTDDRLTRASMLLSKNVINVVSVQKFVSIADTTQMSLTITEGGGGRQIYFPYRTVLGFEFWYTPTGLPQEIVTANTNQNLWELFNNGTNAQFYNNSVAFGASVANVNSVSTANFHMGSFSSGAINANVEHQELIIWNIDQTGNRTAIESNVNGYYSIY